MKLDLGEKLDCIYLDLRMSLISAEAALYVPIFKPRNTGMYEVKVMVDYAIFY